MIFLFIIHLFLFTVCGGIRIGTVNNTRFTSTNGLNSGTVWIHNQTSPKQCLCTALSEYNNPLLFNSYSNGSCQLFFSLPYTYIMEENINSTIIFLSQLPPIDQAPCCSNLTWLITRMQNSLQSTGISNPNYLVIDNLGNLAVLTYSFSNLHPQLYRYNRTIMASVSTPAIRGTSLSYYNKQYFITQQYSNHRDSWNNYSILNIYSTANVTKIANISIPYGSQDYVFIQNGSVMVVAISTPQTIAFYNVTSSTSYISTFNLSAPGKPNTLYCVNDTLLYMATDSYSDPIYTLTYNNTTNNWTWGNMPLTKSSLTTANFQSTMDVCGRLWVSVRGYGICIFDTYGTNVLYNWSLSTGLNGIALTENFDLYAADYSNNEILSYQPGIEQCTS